MVDFSNFHVDFPTSYFLAVCATVLVLYWTFVKLFKNKNLPPGPIGVPILGHLPFLSSEPHRDLHKLGQKYGGIFGIYNGRTHVVILGDYPSLKEALGKSTTTDRPETTFDFIPDGVGFSSVNGEEWVEQRRYCMRAMRNVGLGRDTWEDILQAEVSDFVELISRQNGRPFDPTLPLTASVSRNISALLFGRRLSINDEQADLFAAAIYSSSQFAPLIGARSAFPSLMDALARIGLLEKKAASLDKLVEFNRFVRDQVEERRRQNTEDDKDDFIGGYLQKIKENRGFNLGNTFNETNLHGNIQALFIGASDTTRTSLSWLMLALAAHQGAQRKVQKEADREGGTAVTWAGRGRYPVAVATIMEGQRWRTVAPLNTGRVAMEDIRVGGYDIPKGTTIIANNWGVHNDTNYWTDPEEFRPERFLSADGTQVNLKPESYVPFSYGKRNCPGETVAIMEILFYFVAILRKFNVLPPEGREINLQGTLGLTYQPIPQELCFVPRI
ncbi:hypothetical protein JTE90_016300 [Oedothorax gibbosus]|uniref:Cytochrome P450 n=1 Tax=Oedothorax gibbosus TaxID=931172 RepID=A0AAV6U5Z9_9ARAC|nr:hypothetical protein JTE90_016300 [Oedothorax gibbosus]